MAYIVNAVVVFGQTISYPSIQRPFGSHGVKNPYNAGSFHARSVWPVLGQCGKDIGDAHDPGSGREVAALQAERVALARKPLVMAGSYNIYLLKPFMLLNIL